MVTEANTNFWYRTKLTLSVMCAQQTKGKLTLVLGLLQYLSLPGPNTQYLTPCCHLPWPFKMKWAYGSCDHCNCLSQWSHYQKLLIVNHDWDLSMTVWNYERQHSQHRKPFPVNAYVQWLDTKAYCPSCHIYEYGRWERVKCIYYMFW